MPAGAGISTSKLLCLDKKQATQQEKLGCSICCPYWHQHHLCSKALDWPRSASVAGSPRPASLTARACYSSSVPSSWGVPIYFISQAFQEFGLQHIKKWSQDALRTSPCPAWNKYPLGPSFSQATSITHVPLPAHTYALHHCLEDLLHGGDSNAPPMPQPRTTIQSQSSQPTWPNCPLQGPHTRWAPCLCHFPDTKTGVPQLNTDAPLDSVHSRHGSPSWDPLTLGNNTPSAPPARQRRRLQPPPARPRRPPGPQAGPDALSPLPAGVQP